MIKKEEKGDGETKEPSVSPLSSISPLFDTKEGKEGKVTDRARQEIAQLAANLDSLLLEKRDELLKMLKESGVTLKDVKREEYWLFYIKQAVLACGKLRQWLQAIVDSY